MPNSYVDKLSGLPALQALRQRRTPETVAAALDAVVASIQDVPLPAAGETLARWRFLHAVAAVDLVLAKLVEPHWDARAILAELTPPDADGMSALVSGIACFGALGMAPVQKFPSSGGGSRWAVWAAEPPSAKVTGLSGSDGRLVLNGKKSWCSGAAVVTHALITYWDADQQPALAAIALDSPGVTITSQGWQAVGMDASASVDIELVNVSAMPVGVPGAYLTRPGFWHGGMGIAACWLGGSYALATAARKAVGMKREPHTLAQIGAMDVALVQAHALMRATAAWVDAHPQVDPQWPAFRLRAAAEQCAERVLHHAGRAMGAGPLCRNAEIARLYADLPVFIRQSHAEQDLAALGTAVVTATQDGRSDPWML